MQSACVLLSSVACFTLPYFPTFPHKKGMIFEKTKFEHKIYVLIFPTIFVRNICHSARYYDKRTYVFKWSACCSCQISNKLEFSREIVEKYSSIKFHEIHLLWAELFHADGETGVMKRIVAFRNFARAPKMKWLSLGKGVWSPYMPHRTWAIIPRMRRF